MSKISEKVRIKNPRKGQRYGDTYKGTDTDLVNEYNRVRQRLEGYENMLKLEVDTFAKELETVTMNATRITSLSNQLYEHLVVAHTKLEEFMRPSKLEGDEMDTNLLSTKEGEMEDGFIKDALSIDGQHSSSAINTGLRKTIGNHTAAIAVYKEAQERILNGEKLTPKEMNAMYAAEDHMRFFAYASEKAFIGKEKSDKPSRPLLMAVSRDSMPDNLVNKIWFYDEKSGSHIRGNVAGKKGAPLKESENENIIFVVVDRKGNPIERQGKLLYTSMAKAATHKTIIDVKGEERVVYRHGKSDLIKPEKVIDENKDVYYTGELKQDAKNAVESLQQRREQVLASKTPVYYEITGQGTPMVNKNTGEDSRPSKSIQKKTAFIPLKINLTKGGRVKVGTSSAALKSGAAYVVKNGKLVPVYSNRVTENDVETIYQLLIKYAQNKKKRQEGEISDSESELIDPTDASSSKIIHILKSLVFFGHRSEDSSAPTFDIRTTANGFKVIFGEYGEIEMQHLLDEAADHVPLRDFIASLSYNVNYYLLKSDENARLLVDEMKEWSASEKKFKEELKKTEKFKKATAKMGAKEKNSYISKKAKEWAKKDGNTKPKTDDIKFTPFKKYTVNSQGEISVGEWENYTDFLFGDGNKDAGTERADMSQYPLRTKLVDELSEKDKNYHMGAQFINTYLMHDSKAITLDAVNKKDTADDAKDVSDDTSSDPVSSDTYSNEDINTEIEVYRDATGNVVRVVLLKGDNMEAIQASMDKVKDKASLYDTLMEKGYKKKDKATKPDPQSLSDIVGGNDSNNDSDNDDALGVLPTDKNEIC